MQSGECGSGRRVQHSEEPRRRLQQMTAELGLDVTEETVEPDLMDWAEAHWAEGEAVGGDAVDGGDDTALAAEGGPAEHGTVAGASPCQQLAVHQWDTCHIQMNKVPYFVLSRLVARRGPGAAAGGWRARGNGS